MALLLAGSLVSSAPVQAQISNSSNALSRLSQGMGNRAADGFPLEGALDPEAYLVGPGDVFTFSIGGAVPTQQQARVSADGTLIVPGVGSFAVTDRTLADVKLELQAALRRVNRNVETDVSLTEPRSFYVHVSGAVLEPGRHVVAPIARVEDALVSAMGGVNPQRILALAPARRALALRAILSVEAASLRPEGLQSSEAMIPETRYQPAFRNVLVTHRDGTTERVDLLRYYATGNPDANPYLRDGDAVTLPFYDPNAEGVGLDGAVPEPGVVDHRPGDTALDLLHVALGSEATTSVDGVRLTRARPTGAPEIAVLSPEEFGTTPIEAGDRLFVLATQAARGMATVVGAAAYPASYPILLGETTLRDLIAMAGGFTPDALVRGAYLERQGLVRPDESQSAPTNSRLAFDPTLNFQIREAAIAAASFEQTRLSTLDFASRQYFAREALGTQRVSLNMERVLENGATPVLLQDGDRLVVPHDLGTVPVIGQVTQAGYVPFVEDQDATYYINQAGGLTPGATEVYVVDASTGVYQPLAEAGLLQPGDFIFANRTPLAEDRLAQQIINQQRQVELQERRERSDARFRIVSATLQTLSIAATILAIALR
ncbi:MAG: hypothetical protein HKN04_08985 [Rhodothermaceae bacterium]|nr:hypothetical protein [Rhodothermaceae bacterium]